MGKFFIAIITFIRFLSSVSFFYLFSSSLYEKIFCCNHHIHKVCLQCGFFYEFSNCFDEKISYNKRFSHQSSLKIQFANITFIRFLSSVSSFMYFQAPFWENLLSQTSHSKGFCVVSSFACSKLLEVEKISE